MKVYVSADIEGVTGAAHWDETYRTRPDYAPFREQMNAEVAAACRGAAAAGAEEIWVQDAHESGRNLDARRLPENARLVRGWSHHPFSMVQELDESFRAACLVGYHAPSGSDQSPLAHTMSTAFTRVAVNGRTASEFLLHTYAAWSVGVPVVFLSGDEAVCAEARDLCGGIVTCPVKEGRGESTVSLHPAVAERRIREGTEEALRRDPAACLGELPARFEVEVSFRYPPRARRASFYPGASLLGPGTVRFATRDWFEVMRLFLFV